MIASAQMAGDGPVVIAAAEKLRSLIPEEAARRIALTHPIKAAPYFAYAQFAAPEAILALPDPGAGFPYVQAMWHYARGIAYADKADAVAADAEAHAIKTLAKTADLSALKEAGIPAEEVFALAHAVLRGRIAQWQGDSKQAIASFEEAAALQDALPYGSSASRQTPTRYRPTARAPASPPPRKPSTRPAGSVRRLPAHSPAASAMPWAPLMNCTTSFRSALFLSVRRRWCTAKPAWPSRTTASTWRPTTTSPGLSDPASPQTAPTRPFGAGPSGWASSMR
jgi:hypothetical protein